MQKKQENLWRKEAEQGRTDSNGKTLEVDLDNRCALSVARNNYGI